MKKRIFILLAAIVLAALVYAGFAYKQKYNKATPQEKATTVRVGYRGHEAYAPFFVGLEGGYYRAAGLEIQPIKFESTNQLMEAMLANNIDAAVGGVNMPLLFTIEEKNPGLFKLFGASIESNERPILSLLVKKDSKINTIADLDGKKIGAYEGSTVRILYKKIAKIHNLNTASFQQMSLNLLLPALTAGTIDAAIVTEPIGYIGEYQNASRFLARGLFEKYYNPLFAGSIVSTKFLANNPETTKEFIFATEKAIDYIRQNENQAMGMISRYTTAPKEVANNIKLVVFKKLNEIDSNDIKEYSDLLFQDGELKSAINISSIILPAK